MKMRVVVAVLVTGSLFVPSTSHAVNGMAEGTWSDAVDSNTRVTESCAATAGPSPYNWKCTWVAVADNTVGATRRGMCTEVLATVGSRVIGGPCAATFSVTMMVNRAVADRVVACNGTSINQETPGPEPEPVYGQFVYESTDGLFRTVYVDVNVTSNVVSFEGSIVAADQSRVLDELHGTFRVRCATGTRTDGAWRGDYAFVA